MTEIKKNTLRNTIKDESAEEKAPLKENKPKTPRVPKEKKNAEQTEKNSFLDKINNLFAFARNERFQKIFGFSLLLFSVYLAIAFTSFLFTWQTDQDKVMSDLFSADVQVNNWLGKFGALLSHVFIHKWFGVSSYLFSFVSFVLGLRIALNIQLFDPKKVYVHSLFFLIFTSVALGFVFHHDLFFLGGAFGFTLVEKTNAR